MRIALEHLTMTVTPHGDLAIRIELAPLAPGSDPVAEGFAHERDALSHSTSWRAEGDTLILTFAHVLADGSDLDATWSGSPEDLEELPSACHAVRHLHFLRFTDEQISEVSDVAGFWEFAHRVADHHYPAVAGLLSTHGLVEGGDFVI